MAGCTPTAPLEAGQLTLETAERLRAAGPFGSGFPEPCFDGEFTVVEARVLGEKHLKLWLRPGLRTPPVEAIAFGWLTRPGAFVPAVEARVRLVYRLDVNEYQGAQAPAAADRAPRAGLRGPRAMIPADFPHEVPRPCPPKSPRSSPPSAAS